MRKWPFQDHNQPLAFNWKIGTPNCSVAMATADCTDSCLPTKCPQMLLSSIPVPSLMLQYENEPVTLSSGSYIIFTQ